MSNRTALAAACVLTVACGGPTRPTALDPWSLPVAIADVTAVSGVRAIFAPLSCLAVARDGRAVVLWSKRGPESDELWARWQDASGAVGPPERVQAFNRLPRLADILCGFDDTGDGYVSWVEYSSDASRLLARRFRQSGSDPSVMIDERSYSPPPGTPTSIRHGMAVEPSGRCLIAWTGDAGIRSAVATDGAWADAGLIEARPFIDARVEIKVQMRGVHAVAAYLRDVDTPEGRGLAGDARFLGSSRWGPAHGLGASRGMELFEPTLDEQGRSTVITTRVAAGETFLCAHRFQESGWAPASCLSSPSVDISDPAAGASGEVFALYRDPADQVIKALRWAAAAREPVTETVGTSRPPIFSDTVLSAEGTSQGTWVTADGVWLGRAPRGGAWTVEAVPGSRAQETPPPCPSNRLTFEPHMGADAHERAVVTWIEEVCGTTTLWMQRREGDR